MLSLRGLHSRWGLAMGETGQSGVSGRSGSSGYGEKGEMDSGLC
jgi:hypothetical protein